MDRPPLDVSPVAKFLIGLVERRASGVVQLPQRSIQLLNGDLHDITSAPGDPDFGEFLLRSGRVSAAELKRTREQASAGAIGFEQALGGQSRLRAAEIRGLKRAQWLDRFLRSLRASLAGGPSPSALAPMSAASLAALSGEGVKFLPLVLDALGRIALESDAAAVGVRLKHRLVWLETPLAAQAKQWASFGELPEQPVIAAMLARLPACAPQIAALLRAGFARLDAPGAAPARRISRTETLPPPAPRLAILPDLPPAPPAPPPTPLPESGKPPRGERHQGPRVQLEPGAAGVPIDTIPTVKPTGWPTSYQALHDPIREIEQAVANRTLANPERARHFAELSSLWESRFGSLEEAARAMREAVAADPDDPTLMERAAQHCFRLGQAELAVRYARAAITATEDAQERARQHRLIATVEQSRGDMDACIQALSEAAAEYPDEVSPHEVMAQILSDRDQLPLAAAHVRQAASQISAHDPQRALLLHALAYSWHPSDPALASEYADLLEALGHAQAAVAVVAETARNLTGDERRAALELAAARAERNKRRDLRAELLLEIFDADPSYENIHGALVASMDRPGLEAEHAALLESVAHHSGSAAKALILARAGEALARVDGERESSARYLRRADNSTQAVTSAAALISELDKALAAVSGVNAIEPLARLSALHVEQGEPRAVVSTCLRLLAIKPEHAMAAARLWRATAELSDPVLRREALILLARMRTGREQGRALAVLARHLENMADYDGAMTSAAAALVHDASAADAAVIVLRHVHRLEPRRALSALSQARGLLAAPPALLLSMAEAGRAASDRDAQLDALHELIHGLPFLLQPRLLAVDALLGAGDPELLNNEAEALLSHCAAPDIIECVRRVVARLSELGEHAMAARLAERVMSCQGHIDPAYADRACSYAYAAADPAAIAIALERAASVHDGVARADCLLQLAAHHAKQADRVAELRALLRAVALPEGRARALPLLAARFAESGDANRLLTVLALRLDATDDPAERRTQLFDMACAAITFGNDRPAAAAYMSAVFHECAGDRSGLLFALGGLFALGDSAWATETACGIAGTLSLEIAGVVYLWLAHKAELDPAGAPLALALAMEGARRFPSVGELLLLAERLTLASRDKVSALGLYADLIANAMGPHGRRALHYRAGRWLERIGEPAEALTYYQQAFLLGPGAGVAYHALERAARAAHKLEALVQAQCLLAAALNDEPARAEHLQAAARTCLREMADPLRAIELVAEADSTVAPGRLDACLLEAVAELSKTASEVAHAALRRIAFARKTRAEQLWDGEGKAQLLLSLARLQLAVDDHSPEALNVFESVLNSDLRTSLSSEALASGLLECATLLARCGRHNEADAARGEARLLDPKLAGAYAAQHAADPVPEPTLEAGPALDEFNPDEQVSFADLDFASPVPSKSTSEEALRARAEAGDAGALAELVQRVAADESRRDEAHALLGQLVRVAPQRTDALRLLHSQALAYGAHAEAHVCAQILCLFEPALNPPDRVPFAAADLRSDELSEIVHAGQNRPLAQVLRLLWQHAQSIPRFRRGLESLSLGAPINRQDGTPLALAYGRAASLLGRVDIPLYVQAGAVPEVSVLPTQPPVLVAQRGFNDPVALEFLIARCMVYCEPEHALLCSLPEADGRELLAALLSAFGLPAASQTLSRTDKQLASELWHSVPARTQHELRGLLEPRIEEFDYAKLRAQAERSAQRAGLFVASDATVALAAIARSEPVLRHCDVYSEAGFKQACQVSAAFNEVIRTALSLPYVGLTALALEAQR